jgi:hypothetical protein
VAVLALKLILAPAFVVGASLTARRLGPRAGGLVGGLPVVAGPILLVLAIVHDADFAARAATTALLGLVSLSAFVLTYGFACRRFAWPGALGLAWLAFLAMTALASAVHVGAIPALVLACAAFVMAGRALPWPAAAAAGPARAQERSAAPDGRADGAAASPGPPTWDLPVRAVCAAVMVLVITGASAGLGARLSGLLAPSPIITTVLAVFTHAQLGSDAALRLLRGMLIGFFAFALFCWVAALALPHLTIAAAFALAAAVAVLTQLAIAGGGAVGSRP